MKNRVLLKKSGVDAWHVVSEPGDFTHYDYVVIKRHNDYMFVPYGSSFRYPQKIEISIALEIRGPKTIKSMSNSELIKAIAEEYNCNYFTVVECVRTMLEIQEEFDGRNS